MKTQSLAIATALAFGGVAASEPAPLERMIGSTFKLFNEKSTASCFLVHLDDAPDRPIIVTAAHVFEQMKGPQALLVLRKLKKDGSHERFDWKVPVRAGGKNLWTKHGEHDIAALPLESKPDGVPCPSMPLSALADKEALAAGKFSVGDRIFVLTYPERFEANGAGFPVVRGATVASFPLGPPKHHPSFLADFTAFGGDSGGPVCKVVAGEKEPLVIGIAVAQFRHDEKLTMLNEERQVHHPLGLGKVMHSQFVIETVEAAAKKAE